MRGTSTNPLFQTIRTLGCPGVGVLTGEDGSSARHGAETHPSSPSRSCAPALPHGGSYAAGDPSAGMEQGARVARGRAGTRDILCVPEWPPICASYCRMTGARTGCSTVNPAVVRINSRGIREISLCIPLGTRVPVCAAGEMFCVRVRACCARTHAICETQSLLVAFRYAADARSFVLPSRYPLVLLLSRSGCR